VKKIIVAIFVFAVLAVDIFTQSKPVEPLLQTKWGQGDPYNSLLPIVSNNRPLTDCSNIAIAQIMRFHRHPMQGGGQSEPYKMNNGIQLPSVRFNVNYDWNSMPNIYTSGATGQQRNAVATLVYHIGAGREFDWDNRSSKISVQAALSTFFGYDKSIQRHYRIYYDDAAWEALIREQLDAGLPVYYWGTSQRKTSSHTFVIDGYDNTGKFHVNWGWNGRDDGYYSLNALNPPNYDFNYDQTIVINIKPDEGGAGSNAMALDNFSSEKASVLQNERFTVTARLRSMGIYSGGQIGAALVNNNGNIVAVIGMVSLNPISSGNTWFRTINNCSVPNTVAKGQYRLKIVTRPEGGDWKLVSLSLPDIPNSIDFQVR
jgi:hypothetical protein